MLNIYERVITTTQDIEDRLTVLYHVPPTLQFKEKLDWLGCRIPRHILDLLHGMRIQRNSVAHNELFMFDRIAFEEALHTTRQWLRNEEMKKRAYVKPIPRQSYRSSGRRLSECEYDDKSVLFGMGLAALGLAGLMRDED